MRVLQAFRNVIGPQEGLQGFVILLDGGRFEGTVHPFDLAIGPGMGGCGEPMSEATCLAHTREAMPEGVWIALAVGARAAVIREPGVDPLGDGGDQVAQTLRGECLMGVRMSLGLRQRAGPIDRDEQGERPLFRAYRSDAEVKIAAGILFEALLGRLVPCNVRQAVDAMAPQATMPGGARQVWECCLPRRETLIAREPRVPAACDHQRFCCLAQHGGTGMLRPHRRILDRRPLLPLGHGFGVQVIPLGSLGSTLVTLLDRATRRRSRAGAPVS